MTMLVARERCLDDVLNGFLANAQAERNEYCSPDWPNAFGPGYRQILGEMAGSPVAQGPMRSAQGMHQTIIAYEGNCDSSQLPTYHSTFVSPCSTPTSTDGMLEGRREPLHQYLQRNPYTSAQSPDASFVVMQPLRGESQMGNKANSNASTARTYVSESSVQLVSADSEDFTQESYQESSEFSEFDTSDMQDLAEQRKYQQQGLSIDDASALCQVPLDENGQPTSIGSIWHDSGECKSCIFIHSKVGCTNGALCKFCHFPHKRPRAGKKSRPCKGKRDRYKKLVSRLTKKMDSDPESFDLEDISLPPSVRTNEAVKTQLMSHLNIHRSQACSGRQIHGTENAALYSGRSGESESNEDSFSSCSSAAGSSAADVFRTSGGRTNATRASFLG